MSTLSQLLIEAADGITVNWSKLPSKIYHSNLKDSHKPRSGTHDKSIYDEVQRWSGKNENEPELCCAMGRAKVFASMNDVLSVILFEPFTIDSMLDGADAIEVIPANKFHVQESRNHHHQNQQQLQQHRKIQSRTRHLSYSDEDEDDESEANESTFSSTVIASSTSATADSSNTTTTKHHTVVEEQVTVTHVKVKAVWPASPRDFCVASTVSVIERDPSQNNKPKKVCIVSMSCNHPKCPQPKDQYVRGKLGIGGWIVTCEYDPVYMMEITTITNVTQIDLCGSLPHWIVAETIKNNGEGCGKLKQIIEKRVHHQNWKASPFTLPGDIIESDLPIPQKKDTILSAPSSSFSESISTDNQIEVQSSLTLQIVETPSSSQSATEKVEREIVITEKELKVIEYEYEYKKDIPLETIEKNEEEINSIVSAPIQVITLTNKMILIHGVSQVVTENSFMEIYYDPKYNHSQQG